MSKYTTQLRFICESLTGHTESQGYSHIKDILTDAAPLIFDFEYPIFDETYKETLETKILRHFYTREISEETLGLWKLRLCDRMNRIMPYYNQLYESALLEFNPFYDVDLSKSGNTNGDETRSGAKSETTDDNLTSNSTGVNHLSEQSQGSDSSTAMMHGMTSDQNTTEANSVTDNAKKDRYSDTPQGTVANLQDNTYLTNARLIDEDGTVNSSSQSSTNAVNTQESSDSRNQTGERSAQQSDNRNENKTRNVDRQSNDQSTVHNMNEYIEHVTGKQGGQSYSKMLLEFRETFLNVDQMIIDNLSDLFFLLW